MDTPFRYTAWRLYGAYEPAAVQNAADDRLRKEVLDRYEKEIAGGRQKEYDDAYYRLTKQAETSERLKKSFAQNDPAAGLARMRFLRERAL